MERLPWCRNEESVSVFALGQNVTFRPMPVCLWPPFVFIIYNGSADAKHLNCSSEDCCYSMCWNDSTHHWAVCYLHTFC